MIELERLKVGPLSGHQYGQNWSWYTWGAISRGGGRRSDSVGARLVAGLNGSISKKTGASDQGHGKKVLKQHLVVQDFPVSHLSMMVTSRLVYSSLPR